MQLITSTGSRQITRLGIKRASFNQEAEYIRTKDGQRVTNLKKKNERKKRNTFTISLNIKLQTLWVRHHLQGMISANYLENLEKSLCASDSGKTLY